MNRVFQALADPTRRAVLERLCVGPAAMSELARAFDMAIRGLADAYYCSHTGTVVRATPLGLVGPR